MEWISVKDQLPSPGDKVLTRIKDEHGERNVRHLQYSGDAWLYHNRPVAYTPTDWARNRSYRYYLEITVKVGENTHNFEEIILLNDAMTQEEKEEKIRNHVESWKEKNIILFFKEKDV